MKKIQISTAPIKADAQVIVLNASFVSRVTKAHVELNAAVRYIKSAANVAQGYNETDMGPDGKHYRADVRAKDINRIDRVLDLINDIYFAFNEDEDGTAPADASDDTFDGEKNYQKAAS